MNIIGERYAKPLTGIIWVLMVSTITILCCLELYIYDNKYSTNAPQAQDGILHLDEEALDKSPVLFLVDGWEYYGGRLLSPQNFTLSPPVPDQTIYIGQYSGFEQNSKDGSPHGSASYRMCIILPDRPTEYMLELPEIYSAYRLYINGAQAAAMGDPQPERYRPETGNRTVTFIASGHTEILLAVSDFTHFYSGLVYPPAFGVREAVASLLNLRFLFRSVLAAFALAVGLLSILVGIMGGRNKPALLFGFLCLLFIGYTSYPLWQAFPADHRFSYALENASYYALLVVVILLQNLLYGESKLQRFSTPVILLGIVTCIACFFMPFLLSGINLKLIYGYSFLVMTFQWIAAIWISVTAVDAVINGIPHSIVLMCGILVFDIALLMDRILPQHEPIITGWFPELGSFFLVLSIGITVGHEVATKYHASAVLSERANNMERLLAMQRANYETLSEKIDETRSARHDLRHHLMIIGGFIQNHEHEKLLEYIKESGVIIEQSSALQYSKNDVVNVLLHPYARLAQQHEIALELNLTLNKETGVDDADLCMVLSNLLENAVEACCRKPDNRFISLSIAQDSSALYIHMENSTDSRPIQSGNWFASSKGENRRGYGLQSVENIAKQYMGEAGFSFEESTDKFISTVLLMSVKSHID